MALKPERQVGMTNHRYEVHQVAERGHMMVSVPANNDRAQIAAAVAGTELPLGLLLTDVEDRDFTDQPERLHRDVVASGSVVALASTGEFHTDAVASGLTYATGEVAYLAANGQLSNVEAPGVGSGITVGRFLSAADTDGYVHVAIDIVA